MSRAFSLYLDAIRFLAALLVLFYHANWIYRPGILFTSLGHEAVVIFFVLSGFVIAYVADTREQDFRGFMVARGARIYSVAIPAIILTAVLDAAGFHIDESVYPEGYRAWDWPLIRVITSSFFLNEIWTLGIQLFTNVPYWSLNYEVWYYVLFGILFFAEGRRRWPVFLILCLILGPKIVLLMPVWWMGVWIYRSHYLARIPVPLAWLCFAISLAGGYWYVHVNMGQLGWDYLQQLLGDELHRQLSFSRQFISDYYLGLILSLHFIGLRVLLGRVKDLPKQTGEHHSLSGRRNIFYLSFSPAATVVLQCGFFRSGGGYSTLSDRGAGNAADNLSTVYLYGAKEEFVEGLDRATAGAGRTRRF